MSPAATAETRLWDAHKARTLTADSPTVLLADLFEVEDMKKIQAWYTYMYEPYATNTDAVYAAKAAIESLTNELEIT